jgi:hypothetical protein
MSLRERLAAPWKKEKKREREREEKRAHQTFFQLSP